MIRHTAVVTTTVSLTAHHCSPCEEGKSIEKTVGIQQLLQEPVEIKIY